MTRGGKGDAVAGAEARTKATPLNGKRAEGMLELKIVSIRGYMSKSNLRLHYARPLGWRVRTTKV
jgi:hypothetical protein